MSLPRRTPMRRGGPLQRGAPMPRSVPIGRSGGLRPRSEKMAKLYREQRVPLVKAWLENRPWCEFPLGCGRRAVDVHELLKRSGGGSIVDESNLASSCREHNEWAENHPTEALRIGWVRR